MPYGYGGYPGPGGYYAPPAPDQLAQLRGAYQQPMMNNPMQTQQPMMQQPVQATQPANLTGPVYVNGEAGARGFMVGAGNTVMLIDADPDSNTFWLKSADAAGMPSMRTFDYTERTGATKAPQEAAQETPSPPADYVLRSDFNAIVEQITALEDEVDTLKAKRIVAMKKNTKEDAE